MSNEIMTVEDVAEYLQLSSRQIANLTKNGGIPFLKIETSIRYRKSDVDAWLATKLQNPLPPVDAQQPNQERKQDQ